MIYIDPAQIFDTLGPHSQLMNFRVSVKPIAECDAMKTKKVSFYDETEDMPALFMLLHTRIQEEVEGCNALRISAHERRFIDHSFGADVFATMAQERLSLQ